MPQLTKDFHVDEEELLTLWLADRILDALDGEGEIKFKAIDVAKRELDKVDFLKKYNHGELEINWICAVPYS